MIYMGQLYKTNMISKPKNYHSKNDSIGSF